jgi:D-glycero-beta-D-manno-heptose-7-phosphate kinase
MNTPLASLLPRFGGKKIAVWGDYILDEYVFTSTGRVSREAPVLVAELEHKDCKLGGAGNVSQNLAQLGAIPVPVGLAGADESGLRITELLRACGCDTAAVLVEPGYQTASKSRILSGGEHTRKQQVLRIDSLFKGDLDPAVGHRLLERVLAVMATCAGLVVSDYLHHAVLPGLFAAVRVRFPQAFIAIDSRNHLLDFNAMTLATPNEPELKSLFPRERFASDADFIRSGRELVDKIAAGGVILKRGQQGMIVFEPGREADIIPIYGGTDIVDVTGAGDTVLAVSALALLAGATLGEAARLATIAGGLVVMKEGNYPLPRRELEHALSQISPA